jgi:signal transduction histidine kinase/streptogramin lyase
MDTHAQQHLFARYSPKDGLVNNRTRSFFLDSRGRLYITTFGGFSVYDGARFTNYTTENGLAASLVNDIVEMGEDSLWVIPNGTAIHCLVHGLLKDVRTADNYYPVINQLLRCSDGYYYGIADQGLFRYDHNRFVPILLRDSAGHQGNNFLIHAMESDRKLFIITDPQLNSYPGPGAIIVYDLDTHKTTFSAKNEIFYSLVRTPDDKILAATAAGVRMIDPLALRRNRIRTSPMPAPYKAGNNIVSNYLYLDHAQNLWLSASTGVTKIGRDGDRQTFSTPDDLPPGLTNSIFEDNENNIWFANDRNGIVRLISQDVESYSQPERGFTITDLDADIHSDTAWLFDYTRNDLLQLAPHSTTLFHSTSPALTPGHPFIGKRSYLVGGHNIYSIQFLPGERFRPTLLYHDEAVFDGNGCFDRDGDLLLVSDKLTLVTANRIVRQPLNYFADEVAVDRFDRIWTITRSNKLAVYAKVQTDTGISLHLLASYSKGLPLASSRSLAVDNEGRVWIGTRDHGLYCLFFDNLRLQSWKHLTVKDGLSEDFISFLNCDPDNTVWACSPAGLDRIRLDKTHLTLDNLTQSNTNYQTIYKVLPSAHGLHWALLKDGYMKIRPSQPSDNGYRPRVLFSQVLVDNEPVTGNPKLLALPHDRNHLSFFVGAPSFINEDRTRYSYKLEGSSDTAWSAPTAQSAIDFINLPPGRYILRIKASFLTGRYPDQMAAYPFVILPAWWQTSWFRAAAALVLILLLVWGTRFYIRRRLQIERIALERQQAVEKERTRIATDMHDDLGAGLSRIKFLSETIGIKKQQNLPIEEEVTGIRKYSHEMIDKMGEIVWALNERNDSLSDLLSYTRSYAAEYLLEAGVECRVEAPGDAPPCHVSGEFRRNVYLTIKEALHNVVKHANAGKVIIRMCMNPDHTLFISISDDGIGFDPGHIRPFSNGIANMHKRIADIGGYLLIRRNVDHAGTSIQLSVPV